MILRKTELEGVFLIELERKEDERGFFARAWCLDEFAACGITTQWVQGSISFNRKKGTLRGMHYQAPPWEEAKLVRCTMGAIYDVIVDLHHSKPNQRRWLGVELTAQNRRMVFIPEGFAHGFQTLMDDSEVHYQMSERYHPEAARGIRYDDPAFAISWPEPPRSISTRDLAYPEFKN